MTTKAKAIQTLYRAGRITKEGVKQAVDNDIITKDDYLAIVGESYPEPVTPEVVPDEAFGATPEVAPETTETTEEEITE